MANKESKGILSYENILSSKTGHCYVKSGGKTYNFAQAEKVEAKIERETTELNVLGYTGKIHKPIGWKGTGTATLRYNTAFFTRIFEKFKSGENPVFDLVVVNEDPQAKKAGSQRTVLKNCMLDGGTLANFDVNGDTLTQDVSFTFDDFDLGTGADSFKTNQKDSENMAIL